MTIRFTIRPDPHGKRWNVTCNQCNASVNTARKENTNKWRRDHLCLPPTPLTYSQRIRQEHSS